MPRLLLTITALLALVSLGALRAQVPQPAALPSFQTVSILPSSGGLIDVHYSPRTFTARTTSLVELIEQAYGVKTWEVVGGPNWVRTDRFTVKATTVTDVPQATMTLMLRRLLADEFELQLTPETQPVGLYRLTVREATRLTRTRQPAARPTISARQVRDAVYKWEGRSATMSSLAAALAQQLRAPVVDDTKLTGGFDFSFEFADVSAFGRDDGDPLEGRSIVKALEQNLGLMIVRGTGPLAVHTIRRASKPSP
jgi:uncharacterized protein (TIGR03435 family)